MTERGTGECGAMGGALVDPVAAVSADCAPCVAQVASDLDTTPTLRDGLLTESEPMVTLTWLLRVCRDQHTALRAQMTDPAGQRQYAVATGRLGAVMAEPGGDTILDEQVRQELADAVSGPGGRVRPVAALAAVHTLDEHYAHTFAARTSRRPGRVHLGAMAGAVDLVLRTFTGLHIDEGVLVFAPRVPEGLRRVHFQIGFRGHLIDVSDLGAPAALRPPRDHRAGAGGPRRRPSRSAGSSPDVRLPTPGPSRFS